MTDALSPIPNDTRRLADRLKRDWEERGKSVDRDFFIASQGGWNDPSEWAARAQADAGFVLEATDPAYLARADILEIGAGVGRLVPFIAPRVRSYTGIDIAPAHVAEARRRCAGIPKVRFFESDGLTIPQAARDRGYGFGFAAAVLIHCPRDVIVAILRAAHEVLLEGADFRFQILADQADTEGITTPAAVIEAVTKDLRAEEAGAKAACHVLTDRHLIDDRYFMGDRFTFAAAKELVTSLGVGKPTLLRLSPACIFGNLRRTLPWPGPAARTSIPVAGFDPTMGLQRGTAAD